MPARPRSLGEKIVFQFLLPLTSFIGALLLGFYAFFYTGPSARLFLAGLRATPGAPRPPRPSVHVSGAAASPAPDSDRMERSEVVLYVPSRRQPDWLVAVNGTIDTAAGTKDMVEKVVALLESPPSPDALPAIPRGTRVLGVYPSGKRLTVNLSREFEKGHPGGATASRVAVYAVVNTLIELGLGEEVRILVAGHEAPTFRDHVDLSQHLAFEDSIVMRQPSSQDTRPGAAP